MSLLLAIASRLWSRPEDANADGEDLFRVLNYRGCYSDAFRRQRGRERRMRMDKARYNSDKFPWPNPKKPMSFNLRGLPAEVRIAIFEYEIRTWKWGRRTPALLKALRPDSVMYFEALEIYFEVMSFPIITRTQKKIKWMPASIKERIKILEIWYGMALSKDQWGFELSFGVPDFQFLNCPNVHSLYISSSTELRGINWIPRFIDQVQQAVVHLPQLRKLVIEIPYGAVLRIREGSQYALHLQQPTRQINAALRVRPQWVQRIQRRRVTIRWDAEEGERLTWTDDRYFKSIPWQRYGMAMSYFPAVFSHNVVFWQKINLHFSGLNPKRFMNFCLDFKCPCWRIIPTRVSTLELDRKRKLGSPFALLRPDPQVPPVRLGSKYCIPDGFFPGLR